MTLVTKNILETKTAFKVGLGVVVTLATLIMLHAGVPPGWVATISSGLIVASRFCPGVSHETSLREWSETSSTCPAATDTPRQSASPRAASPRSVKRSCSQKSCPCPDSAESPTKTISPSLKRKRAVVKFRVPRMIERPVRGWRRLTHQLDERFRQRWPR